MAVWLVAEWLCGCVVERLCGGVACGCVAEWLVVVWGSGCVAEWLVVGWWFFMLVAGFLTLEIGW